MKFSQNEKEKLSAMLKSTRLTKSVAWYDKVILPKMLADKEKYEAVAKVIGCPTVFVMLIHLRESGSDIGKFQKYLGNGQSLNKKTTIVPKGRGPFKSWSQGAIDALKLVRVDRVETWTLERMLFELEKYNGFGYRSKGINSPYVWNFTNHYSKGRYVSDGKFSLTSVDGNIGAYAFYLSLEAADNSLAVKSEANLQKFPVIDEAPEQPAWLEKVWLFIISLFKRVSKKTTTSKPANDGPRLSRNKKVLLAAANELGVREVPGKGSNTRIDQYFDKTDPSGKSNYEDHVPWCAAFIGWLCWSVGMSIMTGSNLMARRWEKWGISVKHEPLPGDFATFYRNGMKSGQGHLGVFLRKLSNGNIIVLGGNQNDEVNVSSYSGSRNTDIRRSSKSIEFTDAEEKDLLSIADDIIEGREIQIGGKVT